MVETLIKHEDEEIGMTNPMEFNVPDMTCQGCVRSITAAVQRADEAAHVSVDLTNKRVHIEGASDARAMRSAIEDAGFSVTGG